VNEVIDVIDMAIVIDVIDDFVIDDYRD